jgi:hypothetical protein
MNRNFTIWITGALFVVLLPLFFVVLEGMTRSDRLSAARISETPEESVPRQNTTESERNVPAATTEGSETAASQDLKGTTDTAPVEFVEAMPSDQGTGPTQQHAAPGEAGSAFTESFLSDIGYFGGATDSLRGENLVATVVGPSATPAAELDSTGAVSSAVSGIPETAATDSSLPPHPKSEKKRRSCDHWHACQKADRGEGWQAGQKRRLEKKRMNATESKSRSFALEKKSSTSTKRSSADFAAAKESRLLL